MNLCGGRRANIGELGFPGLVGMATRSISHHNLTTRGTRHSVFDMLRHTHDVHIPFPWYASLEKAFKSPRLFQNSPPHPPSRCRIGIRWAHTVPSIDQLYPGTHNESLFMGYAEKSEKNEKESPPLQIDPKWYASHPPSSASPIADWA